jgi:hypothetical protein
MRSAALHEADMWLEGFRRFWTQRLDALATELARGKRERRIEAERRSSGSTAIGKDRRDDGHDQRPGD